MRKWFLGMAAAMLLTGSAVAGEKDFLHCFYFTAVDGATDADWQAFYKATDALPGKIPGLKRVWYGKLQRPLATNSQPRQWGVCMEMESAETLSAYGKSPAHADWDKVYSKVRVEGTSTVNFTGQ